MDKKVAVIGSGPAGLTCAYYIAQEGYRVTAFETDAVLSGMLATGIPAYQLPQDVIAGKIQVIRDLGVNIKTGITLGRNVIITGLRNDGYKAFFFGVDDLMKELILYVR